jgi:lipoprotein-anchoring transpeptidase ErfK/SrfK
MKKLMHIRWLEWTITLCAIVAVAIMLSVSGAQAERVFAGAPAAQAKVGIRVAANASVPRTHGPVSKEIIDFATNEPVGTIIISNEERTLIRVLPYGKAEKYLISVGRDGFTWTGVTRVGRKVEWPAWRPPSEMRKRQPDLPDYVPPGPYNPLGARALYLHSGGRDTLYRIHGTNDSATLGGYETSGCFRLSNSDVMDLFTKVKVGTKVIVK